MGTFAVILQILIWIVIAAILIYLVARRIKISETENFDKRDN